MTQKTKPSPRKRAIEGQIDGLIGQGLSGWALRPATPEERLWIELIVDGFSLGIGRAEHFHPKAASYGDGCYGFWIPVPAAVVENPLEVGVRVANSGETFAPAQRLKGTASQGSRFNQVVHDSGLRLSGWAIDGTHLHRTVNVCAKIDGKRLAMVQANERRFKPEHSDGHGFLLTLPLKLADGTPHYVDVLDDKNKPLHGSPICVQTLPERASDWLQGVRVTKEHKQLLQQLLQRYEDWLPKSLGFTCYSQWKKSFPPDLPVADTNAIALCPANTTNDQLRSLAADNTAVLLMSEGVELLPHALEHLTAASSSGASLVYGDGEAKLPLCKPAWDPYLFCGHDYLGPVMLSSQVILDLDLSPLESPLARRTRLILAASEKGVCHLPLPLSHGEELPLTEAEQAERRQILQEWSFFQQAGASVTAHPQQPHLSRLQFPLRSTPLVSIIIPTRDRADLLSVCLDSLWQVSTYKNVEILIVDNGSVEEDTLRLFRTAKRKKAKVLPYPHQFNYAAMNNFAVRQAKGEVLCFLNNDTQVLTPDWLQEMLSLLQQPQVGCVGAKLLWPNDLVQHGGVVVGTHQLAAHVGNGWTKDSPGYMNRNQLTQQWSAVTAACLLTRRSLFLDSGAFDAVHFPVAFNDVDYCLRLGEQGKKIMWTPWAQLNHHESASRGKDVTAAQKARNTMEIHHFRTKWGYYEDPFYNPNLTLSAVAEPFDGLALPPRKREIRS
jgi:GT2 family glycosyltransferase